MSQPGRRLLQSIAKEVSVLGRHHAMPDRAGLTDKEALWVENYFQHFNASRASQSVGCKGNTRKHGWRMKHNPRVQSYIDSRLEGHYRITDEILFRISEIARASMDYFITGTRIDLKKAQEQGKLHLIKRYRKTKSTESIELVDSLAALDLLAKIYGLYKKGRKKSRVVADETDLFAEE